MLSCISAKEKTGIHCKCILSTSNKNIFCKSFLSLNIVSTLTLHLYHHTTNCTSLYLTTFNKMFEKGRSCGSLHSPIFLPLLNEHVWAWMFYCYCNPNFNRLNRRYGIYQNKRGYSNVFSCFHVWKLENEDLRKRCFENFWYSLATRFCVGRVWKWGLYHMYVWYTLYGHPCKSVHA